VKRDVPVAAGQGETLEKESRWSLALDRMREALTILDESDAPAEVGAELDLAINRLAEAIARDGDENG
jgi:hypothetical protein